MRLKKARSAGSNDWWGIALADGRAAVREAEEHVGSAWLANLQEDECEARKAVEVCVQLRKRMLRLLSAAERSGEPRPIEEARTGLAEIEEAFDMSRATHTRALRLLAEERRERAAVLRRHEAEAVEDERLIRRRCGLRGMLSRRRGEMGAALLLAAMCGRRGVHAG